MQQTLEFLSLAALDTLGDPETLTDAQRNALVTEWLQREITRFNAAGLRVTFGGFLESKNALVILSEPAVGVEQRFTLTDPSGDAETNTEHPWWDMSKEERSTHMTAATKSAVAQWNSEGYHVDCMFSMDDGGEAVLAFLCTKVST